MAKAPQILSAAPLRCHLFYTLFVFFNSCGKLVGAGSAVAADDAFQKVVNLIDIHSFNEAGNALKISVAAACKSDRMKSVLFVDFK